MTQFDANLEKLFTPKIIEVEKLARGLASIIDLKADREAYGHEGR